MPISGLTVTYGAVGGIILWSGINNVSLSAAFKDVVTGKALPNNNQNPETGSGSSVNPEEYTGSSGSLASPGDTGANSESAAANQLIAQSLAGSYGWAPKQNSEQWNSLVSLWNQESGWSNIANNQSSTGGITAGGVYFGAYGIPQSLPYSKMPKAAWPSQAGGSSDPATQIRWGLSYIKDTYGSPAAAWTHEVNAGWY